MSARHLTRLALSAAVATLALAIPVTHAQAVLSDYETADKAAQARTAALWRLAFRPTRQVLEQTVASLRGGPADKGETKASVDALIAQAAPQAPEEARRTLWQAASLLLGKPWSADEALLGSLSLRPDHPVATGAGTGLRFELAYPVPDSAGASYTLDLLAAQPTSSATPKRGAVLRRIAAGRLEQGKGAAVTPDLGGVADGFYIVLATVTTPSGASGEIASALYLVSDLAGRQAALQARLDRISGHDAARQTAAYPFALARAMNEGKREVIAYDFPAAIRRSQEIATALEQGRDPVEHARGLQDRAYRFPETGELVPYQLYVPSGWTPDRRWPLVVALHGANLDERNMLGRADGQMQKLAEAQGVIVVAPLGYRINSAYGSQHMGSLLGADPARLRRSGEDVLQVADLVAREYNADPSRTYLTGNSMGGGGTWWIGGHHPERWAAIAPAAFGGVTPDDVPGLSRVPILAVVGDHDELGMAGRVRAAVVTLKAGGVQADYLEIPGGTHASGFDIALPRIFAFFGSHHK
ncbi:carboxylesterase family protein [Novosphingobium rosa]|uniref:carboxylesterase family protein n=1 Tax=Novosphingobium rosa TaxID=76978 RepID=UPI00082FCCA4|nr:alpha/beta hydrolase-fold protein [Novosphingobium rosa]